MDRKGELEEESRYPAPGPGGLSFVDVLPLGRRDRREGSFASGAEL